MPSLFFFIGLPKLRVGAFYTHFLRSRNAVVRKHRLHLQPLPDTFSILLPHFPYGFLRLNILDNQVVICGILRIY